MNEDIEAAIREITLPVLIARYGTQMEIARLCGISQGCVSRWRYGVPQRHARMFAWMDRAMAAEQLACLTAADAYLVVGSLASQAGLSDSPEVARALDYFGDLVDGEPGGCEILPWGFAEDRGND